MNRTGLVFKFSFFFLLIVTAGNGLESKVGAAAALETRCGWFENPTPANAWLVDRDGEWLIGAQGGYQAEGDWPAFKNSQWVKTNINYGHGCACMKVTTDRAEKRILKIASATAKPLSACRRDKGLKGKEPVRD